MRRRWLVIAVILTVAQGCDNVTWGGVDVRLQGPPPRDSLDAAVAEAESPEAPAPDFAPPSLPILLAGDRDGARATLAVVGELAGDGLTAFPSDEGATGELGLLAQGLLASGTEFVLFSEGVRVGRLVADSAYLDDSFCVARPAVSGTVELVPSAANASRLLAMPAPQAGHRPYGTHRSLAHNYDQRVASLRMAGEAIPAVGARWPASILDMRADIRAFQFEGAESPAIAATFVFRDQLEVGSAPDAAYSLFVIGEMGATDYETSYVWYRPVETDGKGAPRFFDHLDLNGDGEAEVVLEVLGQHSRWFASLSRRNGTWTTSFQDSCGQSNASR
jgi:hypothetical protein